MCVKAVYLIYTLWTPPTQLTGECHRVCGVNVPDTANYQFQQCDVNHRALQHSLAFCVGLVFQILIHATGES